VFEFDSTGVTVPMSTTDNGQKIKIIVWYHHPNSLNVKKDHDISELLIIADENIFS
jgi:hypothetical protein